MKPIQKTLLIATLFCAGGFYSKSMAQSHDGNATPQASQFLFPVGCTQDKDCWPVNYVDVDPTSGGVRDFKCGPKTYDEHKGTDFALGSVVQMNAGVDVLAAAEGKVLRVRDSETDTLKTEEEMAAVKESQKECGNGVLIDHGNGLQTMYCHLKQGSVVVKPGEKINAGTKIAQVGQSGMAEFPHLHFGVMWEGDVVDPYTGLGMKDGCGQVKNNMWLPGLPMDYIPVAIFDGGFREKSPDFEAIQRGEENPKSIPLNAAAFVFWTGFYNVEAGDEITMTVTDPSGQQFVERKEVQKETRARQYYFAGRKIGNVQLQKGVYSGKAVIKRTEGVVREKDFSVVVE